MEVFVDTSAWFRFVVAGRSAAVEAEHAAVRAAFEDLLHRGTRLVTTNLVVAETHQLLLIRTDRRAARAFLGAFPAPGVEVVRVGEEHERRAVEEWLDRYGGQNFSLTDAVSFAVMTERRIGRALALDRHFATAGFEVLPSGMRGR